MNDNDNNSNIAKIIGNNIKKIRNKEHISQEKLAELIGKSAHLISLLERGETRNTFIDIPCICFIGLLYIIPLS